MAKEKNNNKQAAIDALMSEINNKFGDGKSNSDQTIMILGKRPKIHVDTFSTGSLKVDQASGIGGFPFGRMIEIVGMESSGKTTLTLQGVAEAQKMGKVIAFVDVEHAFNTEYAKSFGIDVNKLIFSQPNNGEDALQICIDLANSGIVDVIVLDSLAGLISKASLEGEMEDIERVGGFAKKIGDFCKRVIGPLHKHNCALLLINQYRDNISTMGMGPKKITTGGKAVQFFASQRIEITKVGQIKKGEERIGDKTKVVYIKNKIASPFKVAQTSMYYGEGFSTYYEILDLAVEYKIVKKAGAWYSYNDEKIGQGAEKTIAGFKNENKDIYEEIKKIVLDKIKPKEIKDDLNIEEDIKNFKEED